MIDDVIHLNSHETLRILSESPGELAVEVTWTPGDAAPPMHRHPAQDEHFEVRSGRLTAVVDGVGRELGPGDTLEVPRGTTHKMWSATNERTTAVWRTRPAGRTAEWFRTLDKLGEGGTRKPQLPALAKALTEYSDVFQLEIRPRPVRPLVYLALRILALAARR